VLVERIDPHAIKTAQCATTSSPSYPRFHALLAPPRIRGARAPRRRSLHHDGVSHVAQEGLRGVERLDAIDDLGLRTARIAGREQPAGLAEPNHVSRPVRRVVARRGMTMTTFTGLSGFGGARSMCRSALVWSG
jgi:hypothetical protein